MKKYTKSQFTKSQYEIIKLSGTIIEYLKKKGEPQEKAEAWVLEILKESITPQRQNYKEAAQNLRMVFCEAFGETTEEAIHREAMNIIRKF